MLKIGMDKTDRTFRHFEYDDERKYGNPLRYKVLYEESGTFGEVLCSNIISIKKSNNTRNHFLDIPVYDENKTVDVPKQKQKVVDVQMKEQVSVIDEVKKTKTKKKSKTTSLNEEETEVKGTKLEITQTFPTTFEYDVFVVDNVSYTDDIKYKLNEFGKDGWEVCGFQIVPKAFGFGSQAIIIMKKGLN
jgi:hypothetical protein